MDVQVNKICKISVDGSFSDQHFLLNFVMSNYLGPDVYSDNPRYSASQRLAKGLPPYTSKNLGPSFLSLSQLESLYHYVLRHANSCLLVKPNTFHKYLKGTLTFARSASAEDSRQFTSFFPLNLHEHKRYSASHEIVKGIVLIDDPVKACIKNEELERFKCLSSLDDLKIDKVESLRYQHVIHEIQEDWNCPVGCISNQNGNSSAEIQETCKRKTEETVSEHFCDGNPRALEKSLETYKRRRHNNSLQRPVLMSVLANQNGELRTQSHEKDGSAIVPLLTLPDVEGHVPEASITLTGTASRGTPGPPVGVVDIGVSKVAYFFQVALPGVRKDYCDFSCEIESDGKVILQGSTSGGETVKTHSRVFQMNFRQLCRPGPFTLSFNLPGPVDPRLFSPNFRSDGIFEAVIIRHDN